MSWGKAAPWVFLGTTHRHSASSGIFFQLIAHLLTSSFSRGANNFLWIARMCSATGRWQINRFVVPFAPPYECHEKTGTVVGPIASTACLRLHPCESCSPAHFGEAPARSERFRRQSGYVRSHTLCSWGRDKFLQLHKMLGLKLCIIVFSIISISCVFKFCFPGQCSLLQLTCNLLHWALSSLHLRREAIIDLWKRCPT